MIALFDYPYALLAQYATPRGCREVMRGALIARKRGQITTATLANVRTAYDSRVSLLEEIALDSPTALGDECGQPCCNR